MLKSLKIKSQIVLSTAFILGIIIVLQIFLCSILQRESNKAITSVFDSIAQNAVGQITKMNDDIAEASLLLAVHQTTQESLYEYTPVEIVKNSGTIQNLLNDYMSGNQNIVFLGLIKNRSLFMSSETVELYDYVRNVMKEIPVPKNSSPIFLPSFTYEGNTYFTCVTPVFPTNFLYLEDNHAGNFVVCIYEMGSISYVPSGVINDDMINLVITDSNNHILLSSNPQIHGEYFDIQKEGKPLISKTVSLEKPRWKVITYMPSGSSSLFSALTLFFIIFMIIFTIAMLILMLKLLNTIIVKRINSLKEGVEKISHSNTAYRVSYMHNDELSPIATTVNTMLDTMHTLNEEKLQTMDSLHHVEILQRETTIFYLHSQMSPHFLYNSMVHIQGLAMKHNIPEITQMVISLSKVFRYFSNNQSISTIRKDLDCAIEYFNIINTRRTNKIKLINSVDNELYNVPCLKMIYQPILENVLKHAYEIDDDGTVEITSVYHESKAIIEITDDGKGIPKEILSQTLEQMQDKELNRIQNSEHVGLININARLKLFYNDSCGIEIDSAKGKGTTVRIIFEKEIPQKNIYS